MKDRTRGGIRTTPTKAMEEAVMGKVTYGLHSIVSRLFSLRFSQSQCLQTDSASLVKMFADSFPQKPNTHFRQIIITFK